MKRSLQLTAKKYYSQDLGAVTLIESVAASVIIFVFLVVTFAVLSQWWPWFALSLMKVFGLLVLAPVILIFWVFFLVVFIQPK